MTIVLKPNPKESPYNKIKSAAVPAATVQMRGRCQMYAQITGIRVPINQMSQLRQVIESKYLPVVRGRPGFLAGYLLEQVDDPNSAQLVLFWDSHKDVEN